MSNKQQLRIDSWWERPAFLNRAKRHLLVADVAIVCFVLNCEAQPFLKCINFCSTGGHPGPHIPDCYMFDNTIAPGNGQWTKLPSLPEGRGGGGMTHNVALNTLTYAGGAERPSADSWFYLSAIETIDYQHTWTLELDNIRAGWQVEIDIPYLGTQERDSIWIVAFRVNSNH